MLHVVWFCSGTKWCGPGDIAQSYDELGALVDVDKCCRAHDHCPIKVKGFASAHGLMNLSFYTKYGKLLNQKNSFYITNILYFIFPFLVRSHCACDDEFFSCLKALPTPVSRMIGNLYFNVIQMPVNSQFFIKQLSLVAIFVNFLKCFYSALMIYN